MPARASPSGFAVPYNFHPLVVSLTEMRFRGQYTPHPALKGLINYYKYSMLTVV